MIPHKSKLFRAYLDLTFKLRKKINKREKYESVNSATTKLAPQQAMGQLSSVVPRIVATMAEHFDPFKPFMFTKLDIKDGFWRMSVSDRTESPPCFCAGTETARDLTKIILPTVADLDVHPLEHKIEPLHAELI